jgi:threonine dehydrogenase-like Zn-dependent dehydrogenase
MKATVFRSSGRFAVEDKPVPGPGIGEAIVKVTLTTIGGSDIHIVKGEYPVRSGLTIGHEAVGVIHELGDGVYDYEPGQRVLIGAITPCGQCEACLSGHTAQCGGQRGGWRLGNTIDGCQAEYVRIPYAQANLAPIPDSLSDEQVILLSAVASTGFAAAESGPVKLGDYVAVFGQGPIGLCATLGAHLMGAARVFAVDRNPFRLEVARRFGATDTLLAVPESLETILTATHHTGVDVAIEALGIQDTFSNALAILKPGGTLSSVGVYSRSISVDVASFGDGLAEKTITTSLCPGGKERMLRLLRLVESKRIDLTPLLTHHFPLENIVEAYDLCSQQRDNVLKVAVHVR